MHMQLQQRLTVETSDTSILWKMEDVYDVRMLAYYDLFMFFLCLNMPKAFCFGLSPGMRGCLSVSERNWRTKQTVHLSTSVGKIAHTHALHYIQHTNIHIQRFPFCWLLTTMLNIGFSIVAMRIIHSTYCIKAFRSTTFSFKIDVAEASFTFSHQLCSLYFNERCACIRAEHYRQAS